MKKPARLLSLRDEKHGTVVFIEGMEGYVRERDWRVYTAHRRAERERLINQFEARSGDPHGE